MKKRKILSMQSHMTHYYKHLLQSFIGGALQTEGQTMLTGSLGKKEWNTKKRLNMFDVALWNREGTECCFSSSIKKIALVSTGNVHNVRGLYKGDEHTWFNFATFNAIVDAKKFAHDIAETINNAQRENIVYLGTCIGLAVKGGLNSAE
jgi:hypothetical protein